MPAKRGKKRPASRASIARLDAQIARLRAETDALRAESERLAKARRRLESKDPAVRTRAEAEVTELILPEIARRERKRERDREYYYRKKFERELATEIADFKRREKNLRRREERARQKAIEDQREEERQRREQEKAEKAAERRRRQAEKREAERQERAAELRAPVDQSKEWRDYLRYVLRESCKGLPIACEVRTHILPTGAIDAQLSANVLGLSYSQVFDVMLKLSELMSQNMPTTPGNFWSTLGLQVADDDSDSPTIAQRPFTAWSNQQRRGAMAQTFLTGMHYLLPNLSEWMTPKGEYGAVKLRLHWSPTDEKPARPGR